MVPQQRRRRRRVARTNERRVVIGRGAGGFGFTIAGQRPCVVSAVAAGGPAERAGLRAGDALLAVDGANVARAPHAAVARLVAAAPDAIALSVALRDSPPTDTEDTEPDERARTRRRHPPARRRPHAQHHPACHAAPSTSGLTSGVNEILHNLSRAQLTPIHSARLECRAVVGYLGTIETPQAASTSAPNNVRSAVRKLRQERRPATPVLLSVLPSLLLLRRPTSQVLAQYQRERILYAGCGSESDRRFFGLVTAAETPGESGLSHSCHIFAVDPRTAEHESHSARAREFQITCTRDPVAERCLEFPPSAEYVVGIIRGMYSLPPDDCVSPLLQISKLAIKGDSPAAGHFSRGNRPVLRGRDRRPCGNEDGEDFVANSPQPSNHSEITTTSSNSDSGIGFHNDCRNIADRILVVDFMGPQPPPNRIRLEAPRRPMGVVGCSSFDAEASFLSNTTPVVDGFGGQGRPLNLDDVMLNANDLQPVCHISPRKEDDNYNYNNVYGNFPCTSRYKGAAYDEGNYELLPSPDDLDAVASNYNSVEIYDERSRNQDYQSNESVENVTVISGGTSKASMDSVSVYSSRSHEEAPLSRRKHLQASLDDMLVLGMRDRAQKDKDDGTFLHPASVKFKVRKSSKNIFSRTRHMLTGRHLKERRRAVSASAGDVTADQEPIAIAASEPDLRTAESEQPSQFRRWTTGSGSSSYRHQDHRNAFNKQMSEGSSEASCSGVGAARGQWPTGGVARWSLGLDQLLADPVGRAAFAEFLAREYAHENIKFWCSCEEFNQLQDPAERAKLAKCIWERHLADEAPEPVNVDASARRTALARRDEVPVPQDLFHQAQRQIFHVMRMDSYQRFLRSGQHAECARADLRGLPPPPPYSLAAADAAQLAKRSATPPPEKPGPSNLLGNANNAPSRLANEQLQLFELTMPTEGQEISETSLHDSGNASRISTASWLRELSCCAWAFLEWLTRCLSQHECCRYCCPPHDSVIKKSSSNASDRRRSGGPSLLPWRRVPTNERHVTACAPPREDSLPAHASNDPGKRDPAPPAAQRPGGAERDPIGARIKEVYRTSALCRVVLPDGATSVVGVEQSVPVHQLVDRLLQKRNITVLTYDVLYKDPSSSGLLSTIDPGAPSSVLAGMEVLVEVRCLVKIEVGGRVVAVRCRPARRLRHVLRPVLARYARPTNTSTPPFQVLRNGVRLHPDCEMHLLDGARLQIVDGTMDGEENEGVTVTIGNTEPEDVALHDNRQSQATPFPYAAEAGGAPRAAAPGAEAGAAAAAATAAPTAPGASVAGASGARGAGGAGTVPDASGALHASAAGRVRASLRPGFPIHNHPFSFLDNLKDAQRQRLQKEEPDCTARTPPPLPPKPTLV